jgi:hypothetical protein
MKKLLWFISVITSFCVGSQWPLIKGHLMANYSTDGVSLSDALDITNKEEFDYESIIFNGYDLLHLSSDKTETLYVSKDNYLISLGNDHLYVGTHRENGGCSININDSKQHLNYDFIDSDNNIIGSINDLGRDGVADTRSNFKTGLIEISIDNQWYKIVKGSKDLAINSSGEEQEYKRDGNRYLWQ